MQATYLAECFWPGVDEATLIAATERVQGAAGDLRSEGQQVTHLDSILVPVDEIVFWLFDAPSEKSVGELSRRAGLQFERVVETVRLRVDAPPEGARGRQVQTPKGAIDAQGQDAQA